MQFLYITKCNFLTYKLSYCEHCIVLDTLAELLNPFFPTNSFSCITFSAACSISQGQLCNEIISAFCYNVVCQSLWSFFGFDKKHNSHKHCYLIALLISSDHAHSLDEGVPRVVHTSLDALVQAPVVGGELVTQPGINSWGQSRCHAIVVLAQIREVGAARQWR